MLFGKGLEVCGETVVFTEGSSVQESRPLQVAVLGRGELRRCPAPDAARSARQPEPFVLHRGRDGVSWPVDEKAGVGQQTLGLRGQLTAGLMQRSIEHAPADVVRSLRPVRAADGGVRNGRHETCESGGLGAGQFVSVVRVPLDDFGRMISEQPRIADLDHGPDVRKREERPEERSDERRRIGLREVGEAASGSVQVGNEKEGWPLVGDDLVQQAVQGKWPIAQLTAEVPGERIRGQPIGGDGGVDRRAGVASGSCSRQKPRQQKAFAGALTAAHQAQPRPVSVHVDDPVEQLLPAGHPHMYQRYDAGAVPQATMAPRTVAAPPDLQPIRRPLCPNR